MLIIGSDELCGCISPSSKCPGKITSSMGLPSQQWNGQIVPLLNTTIKGTIWYQGESNHGQNELYTCRYEQLMTEWREQWHIGTGGATDPNMPMGELNPAKPAD